ncbi:MAG: antibiotic biosynthesis monooxygenase [Proteobacteria bacterium]|nr:antibiotic biosynthesis monooxygenase [Pseudomonadota bacterium]MBS0461479.1 antibiotic biosynthesis monooxygenase [Pseudomonadota bacterium]MBS0463431.1 antibiotic biosynthesis monooxygenase [Pseudomonadota bacterium]
MSADSFASTPEPPYFAVIFSSQRTDADPLGYYEASERMLALAPQQAGFLGIESVRGADGFGITVSYWDSEAAITAWKHHAEHTAVRKRGRLEWYEHFELRVAKVERAYAGPRADR